MSSLGIFGGLKKLKKLSHTKEHYNVLELRPGSISIPKKNDIQNLESIKI